jgi:hypothetical protein
LEVRLLHVASTSVHPPTAHRATASVQRPVQIVTAILNLVLDSRPATHVHTHFARRCHYTCFIPCAECWETLRQKTRCLLSILCILFVVVLCEAEREQDEATCLTF